MKFRFTLLIAGIAAFAVPAMAFGPTRTIPVRFAKGTSSKSFNGVVKNYDLIEYTIRARAGQTMTVRLESDLPSNVFQVDKPKPRDSTDYKPMHDSNFDGNNYRGRLPVSGNYYINVLIFGEDARQHRAAHYRLTISITD